MQVRTKADLPQDWATTQNNLGLTLARQGDWIGAVEASEHALEIYPDDVQVLAQAEGIYHEHLFLVRSRILNSTATESTWTEVLPRAFISPKST